jgi:putative PIN family toxin of toxin-antitoxin system
MKILIDTNVLVSAVLRDRIPEQVVLYIAERPELFDWVVSKTILAEYKAVLSRPKLKIVESIQEQWFNLIDEATKVIDVDVSVEFPRDPKDAKFLECAIAANADYFITGDRDFNVSTPLTTQIISLAEFQAAIIQRNE